ncbi:hypothetical protein GCM10009424_30620 [Sphingomonas ursincola]
MTGGRAAVVPQSYHERVARDAFNPLFHPIGDPLVPTCSIYTHKAVKSGSWSDPTVWDVGTVPGANAVVCSGEFDLVYDVLSDVLIKDIHINGRGSLSFSTSQRTRLWVDTLAVDGRLVMGYDAEPIRDSGIVTGGKRQPMCEVVFWASEAPLQTARLGLNTMGAVRIHGARKEAHLQVDGSVMAGATSCALRQNAGQAGWKVGDEIMFVGTEWSSTSANDSQYAGPTQYYMGDSQGAPFSATQNAAFKNNQTEVRTITEVSGRTIRWTTPLAFNHLVEADTLPRGQAVVLYPVVAMLSHSIRFRTADATDTPWTGNLSDLQKRAHAMFMFSDDIQIRYGEFRNMGRTASDPSLNGPDGVTRYASAGTSQPITNVNNIHGRYAIHIHRTGAFFGRKQVVVQGCSAWAPTAERPIPGWAIVHHDSRAAIDECNVYNFRGAGIVSELGNETGQWIGNVVAWGRGDGFAVDWGRRAELWQNHNGHSGVGFESQARQILQQDNYVSGCRHGWLFMQQDANRLPRIPDGDSLRYRDPITLGGGSNVGGEYDLDNDTYGIEQAQVPDFFRNHAWDCSSAFWKAHQVNIDRADPTPFIFKECHWVNCNNAYNLINYTFHYYVYDSLWTGRGVGLGTAAALGAVMWNNSFINMKIRDFGVGFQDVAYSIAYQGYWHEVDFQNVTTPFAGANNANFGVDPTTRAAWNIMGGAQVTGATTGISRVWSVTRDEDLPLPYPLAPFGPNSSERAANPCPPLGGDPYVVLLGAQDTALTPTGTNQYSIRALVVDSLGYRWHGDNQNQEDNLALMTPKQSRPNVAPGWATGTDIARRNGVFNDAGTWKTRAWFPEVDRATGNHFLWYIDFTLSGFDAGFLAANTVDPMATRPTLPLLPERVRTGAIVAPALHTITSAAAISNLENTTLVHNLTASIGTVRWAITGGADASHFEIVYTAGRWVMRWASNGTKDFEAPGDVGANNVYNVTVTATDFLGRTVNQAIVVTVTDVLESVTNFSDTFSNASASPQLLSARSGYELVAGFADRFTIPGSGGSVDLLSSATNAAYRLPNIGRTNNFQMRARFPAAANVRLECRVNAFSGAGIVMSRNNSDSTLFVFYSDGTNSLSWTYANPNNGLCALTLSGLSFTVTVDGVVRTPTVGGAQTITAALPGTARFFVGCNLANVARAGVLDDLYIGPA